MLAKGVFVLAKGILVTPVCPISMGEALGLFYELEWLGDMSFDNVDFALDSKITTDLFNGRRVDIRVWPGSRCMPPSLQH